MFRPAVPLGGFAGWTLLKRTEAAQRAAFEKSPALQRDADYFRAKIGTIRTAEALVADRRLLSVALGAFGLEGDINNKAFIQRILEDGTLDTRALANRLSDPRYREFSAAFGFGNFNTPSTVLSDFPDKILSQYRTRQFEAAVGESDNGLRLALNAERELPKLAARSMSNDAKWFTLMGNRPLRQVFETALRVPASVGALDLDRQLAIFKTRAEAAFGSADLSQFTDPAKVSELIRRQTAGDAIASVQTAGAGNAALTLLGQAASFSRRF